MCRQRGWGQFELTSHGDRYLAWGMVCHRLTRVYIGRRARVYIPRHRSVSGHAQVRDGGGGALKGQYEDVHWWWLEMGLG